MSELSSRNGNQCINNIQRGRQIYATDSFIKSSFFFFIIIYNGFHGNIYPLVSTSCKQ